MRLHVLSYPNFWSIVLIFCLFSCAQDGEIAKDDNEIIFYVGTYTRAEGHVDGKAKGIHMCKINSETGEMALLGTFAAGINPSFIVLARNGKYLYAVNEHADNNGDGEVSAFEIHPETGALKRINSVSSLGGAPCYIDIDNDTQLIYVANYVGGNCTVIPIFEDGRLGTPVQEIVHQGKSVTQSQKSPHPHMVYVQDRSVFVPDLGTDQIYQYQRTGDSLRLVAKTRALPGAGPRHLDIHPTGKWAYVVNELNGTVDVLSLGNGKIKGRIQVISTLPDSSSVQRTASSADIHITPDGRFLYASNRGAWNTIAGFKINHQSGKLTPIGQQSTRGAAPRNFAITPNGKFLIVANQNSDNIVAFKINLENGRLGFAGYELKVATPVCIKFK